MFKSGLLVKVARKVHGSCVLRMRTYLTLVNFLCSVLYQLGLTLFGALNTSRNTSVSLSCVAILIIAQSF